MRVLVCGARTYNNIEHLYSTLDKLHKKYGFDVVIEGDARGADRMAGYWARKNKLDNLKFPADWEKYGRAAGFIRNKQMLDEGQPDLVIAFGLTPESKGTRNMVDQATKAGIEVVIIDG